MIKRKIIHKKKFKKDFSGAFRGIGPFTKEDELKGQLEVGKIKKSGFGLLKGIGKFANKEREEMWGERI